MWLFGLGEFISSPTYATKTARWVWSKWTAMSLTQIIHVSGSNTITRMHMHLLLITFVANMPLESGDIRPYLNSPKSNIFRKTRSFCHSSSHVLLPPFISLLLSLLLRTTNKRTSEEQSIYTSYTFVRVSGAALILQKSKSVLKTTDFTIHINMVWNIYGAWCDKLAIARVYMMRYKHAYATLTHMHL